MLNKVQIIGNLGADPEVRSLQNGGRVANLNVATSRRWKDKNTGEPVEKTEWHRVVLFADHAAGYAEQYLRKGSKVYVEGSLETRKWQTQTGEERYATEVVVRPYGGTVIGLDGRASSGQDGGRGGQKQQRNDSGGARDHGQGHGQADSHYQNTFDDEIPF